MLIEVLKSQIGGISISYGPIKNKLAIPIQLVVIFLRENNPM